MAITNTNVTVNCFGGGAGTATALTPLSPSVGSLQDPMPVTVYNPGVAGIFVGGSTVTTSNGIPIAVGASANFGLIQGDILYAITATVTTTVNVMKGRQ